MCTLSLIRLYYRFQVLWGMFFELVFIPDHELVTHHILFYLLTATKMCRREPAVQSYCISFLLLCIIPLQNFVNYNIKNASFFTLLVKFCWSYLELFMQLQPVAGLARAG